MEVVDLTADSPLPPCLAEAAESHHAAPSEEVLCDQCQQLIPLQDWDSHSVAHELEQEAPQLQQHDQESSDAALAAALAAAGASESNQLQEQEQFYFRQLQQQYGFVEQVRPPCCSHHLAALTPTETLTPPRSRSRERGRASCAGKTATT